MIVVRRRPSRNSVCIMKENKKEKKAAANWSPLFLKYRKFIKVKGIKKILPTNLVDFVYLTPISYYCHQL